MTDQLDDLKILVKQNCLEKSVLNSLLELSESLEFSKTGWSTYGNKTGLGVGLRSWTATVKDHQSIDAAVIKLFDEYTEKFNITLSDSHRQSVYLESSIKEYRAEDAGFLDWHQDVITGQQIPRALSMSLILNDDYQGGSLHFRKHAQQLCLDNLKANTCVIFPTALQHKVEMITQGYRKSFISWYHCDHTGDIKQLLEEYA